VRCFYFVTTGLERLCNRGRHIFVPCGTRLYG
jgi:hypothetical protein